MNTDTRPSRSSTSTGTGLWWMLRQAADRAFGRRGGPSAERLSRAAGSADGAASFEALEQRQMLAIVTIPGSSIDPATGLGTVTGWFDYASPYLFSPIPDPMTGPAMPVVEEFSDEMAFWATQNPAIPPNGTFFTGSAFQIAYRTQADNAIHLLQNTVPGITGFGDPAMDRDLYLNLQGTDQATILFWSGEPQQGGGQQPIPRVTTNVTITFRTGQVNRPASTDNYANDGDTIKTNLNGTRIELLKDGVVVQTFQGNALAALLANSADGRSVATINYNPGFDAFRLSAANQNNIPAYTDQFLIDDISTTYPGTRFGSFVDDRRFSAQFVFTGPAGATVQFLDLYGREMVINSFLGVPMGSQNQIPIIDSNGDGVPDVNDGIGRIIFSNTDIRTSFTMIGGAGSTVDDMGRANPGDVPSDLAGNLDDYEMAGFGFALSNTTPPMPFGLPDGTGSFLIGSPIVRDNSSPGNYLNPNGNQAGIALGQITPANFNRADQGVFVNGTIGSVLLHGAVFGTSQFRGSIQSLNIGVQYGSINVLGDVGALTIASDAGEWQVDDVTGLDPRFRLSQTTGALLIVGRTIGELSVGGRMAMATQVLADINNASRPPLSFIDHVEREVVYAFNPTTSPMAESVFNAVFNSNVGFRNRGQGFFGQGITGQGVFFGENLFRNDNLQNAEYVGYNGTAVRIHGNLGAQDPTNSEDFTDVYAFAADPTREVVIQGDAAALVFNGYIRVVDRRGIAVAALDTGAAGRGRNGNAGGSNVLRFRPDHSDVYYLVLNSAPDAGFSVTTSYDITLSGMAPTTVGTLTTGAGVGAPTNALGGGDRQFLFTLNAGSLGLLRIGVGVTGGDAMLQSPADFINTNQNDDDLLDFGFSSITVPGNLYGIVAGSDIAGANITVGRDLGTLVTGFSPVAGGGGTNLEGDLTAADIRVGGSAGIFDIAGAVGADQDPMPGDSTIGQVSIRTGTRGGDTKGNIGQILVGAYIVGANLTVATSPGSTIDQFIILDNSASELFGPYEIRQDIPRFTLGVGSDLRFADFGLIQRPGDANLRLEIPYNQVYSFSDDAGATYDVSITGGDATSFGSFFIAHTLPTDSAQGQALARLTVNLVGGASLNIVATGTGSGGEAGNVVSIGRIIVNSDNAASQILISSRGSVSAEIDVWRIDVNGTLGAISNTTRGRGDRAGDIVSVDAEALGRITVAGNIGLTDTSGAGPALLGPFLGLAAGAGGTVGGPILVSDDAIDRGFQGGGGDDWDGTGIFVPIQVTDYTAPDTLEDVGSPVDPFLNGVIVRTGDLIDVRADGALGDVIVTGGDLLNAIANANATRPFGAFEGIIGSIYANSINTVDVGDGLRGTGPSPFAQAGIFANNDIVAVNAVRVRNALIEGVILAADVDNAPSVTIGAAGPTQVVLGVPFQGIGTITVTDGFVNGALIQSVALDDWWISLRTRDAGYITGDIGAILLRNTDLVRSEIEADTVGPITITGGAYDATTINAIENVALVTADSFRNSTLLGSATQTHASSITSSRNVGSITTNSPLGDIADLTVDVKGTLTGRIFGGNLLRNRISVVNTLNEVSATTDIKATSIVAGRLRTLTVGRNLRDTQFLIAGPIDTVFAGNEITGLMILSSGPDGRIGSLRANGLIDADISTSGPITILESITSDITGRLVTSDTDGNIVTLRAGRDLVLDALITGNVTTVVAGRNIGRASDGNDRALDIRGNLGSVTAGGQIFSDILVGQSITGTVTRGRAISKPGNDQVGVGDIIAFGRINALAFTGDVNGDIISYSGGIGTITILNGSFRKGRTITALDGNIDSITITGGDLLGNIRTDGDLTLLQLLAGADGWKSTIGISRSKSTFRSADSFRNELPEGTIRTAASDGPTIFAGHDIGRIFLANGSIWEATIQAGRVIRDIAVANGGIANDEFTTAQGTFIIAGDRVERLSVRTRSDHVSIIAGIVSLGDDNRLGGLGTAADTVKEGTIGTIDFRIARSRFIQITAGLNAGNDGLYNTADDRLAPGISRIDSVNVTTAQSSSVYADGSIGRATGGSGLRVVASGRRLAPADSTLLRNSPPAGGVALNASGASRVFTTPFNQRVGISFTGPGRAFYDPTLNRVVLLNTTSASTLTINGQRSNRNNSGASLSNFSVIGSNNASLGSLVVRAFLRGDSTIFIDGNVGTLALGRTSTTGIVGAGGDIATLSTAKVDNGRFRARAVQAFNIGGDFAAAAIANFLDLSSLSVRGRFSGAVSSDQDIDSASFRTVTQGRLRAGGNITTVAATSTDGALISARDTITTVNVSGDVVDSAIYAGVDLGRDAAFGGEGLNADIGSNGTIGTITVAGSFPRSDVSAGVTRGADGFLGTSDDIAADGRSTVGNITIGGRDFGSNINSEQYRVISTGAVGILRADGSVLTSLGNFSVRQLGALPEPVVVTDLNVFEDSRIYRAEFTFNQPIDASTFGRALSIAEVRNGGQTLVGLAQGNDYTVRYNAVTNVGTVTFSRTVTDRSLPQQSGLPGPGLFRFILSGSIFRGASQSVMLDANGDGTTGDDFSQDAVVGDAGDKIDAGTNILPDGTAVDFYAAADLNLLLDSNYASDNNPDANVPVTLRGRLGDHPDATSTGFRAGGDVDVYRISLRAGQVLILGEIQGDARSANRTIFSAPGFAVGAESVLNLPATFSEDPQAAGESQFLIRKTGTYYVVVSGNPADAQQIDDTTFVPNTDPVGGAVGSYRFTVTVFDDGNTGFGGDTDAGDGSLVVNAPLPFEFAGPDGSFGTIDDVTLYTSGRYNFTLNRGPDGQPNTRDDIVSGSDADQTVSTRRSGADGRFGTPDDEVRSVISSAIGLPGAIGVPGHITPDGDVYRLNGGQPILPGTRVRFTFQLTDSAGNIGLTPINTDLLGQIDSAFGSLDTTLLGDVKIALFELPAGTGFSDAKLVASPSAFVPIGDQTPFTNSDGTNSYGYNADGDFFMEIVLPGSQEVASVNVPASYAIYVQGAVRSDYTLDILTQGTGNVQRSGQNVLLETSGGMISWLEIGGITTQLDAFNSSVLGFAGQIDGVDVDDYIVDAVIASLNDIFAAANVDITVSDDAASFEGADFSTVFLAGNTEPNAFFNNGTFGASEHVDLLNIDKNDQAVIFIPSLAQLGNAPDQAGVDNLVRALTAAAGRRIGELLGLRQTDSEFSGAAVSIMASDSVFNNPGPGGVYGFTDTNTPLSGRNDLATDTNFYLGAQNSLQLIQRIVRPRA